MHAELLTMKQTLKLLSFWPKQVCLIAQPAMHRTEAPDQVINLSSQAFGVYVDSHELKQRSTINKQITAQRNWPTRIPPRLNLTHNTKPYIIQNDYKR